MAAILNDHLVAALAAGNYKAFKTIFDAFHASVFYFADRLVGSEQAEDITAEIFAEVWNRREYFTGVDAIRDFVYAAVKKACLQVLCPDPAEQPRFLSPSEQRLIDEDFLERLTIEADLLRRLAAKYPPAFFQQNRD
jgi:DNA-directed RNA polymerase specialized sigma24 family protein